LIMGVSSPCSAGSVSENDLNHIAVGNVVTKDDKSRPQSSLSIIELPSNAEVAKADLYWSGEVLPVGSADTTVDLIVPGGKVRRVHAEEVTSALDGGLVYSCRADVTRHVRSGGLYRIKEMDLDPIRGKSDRPGSVLGRWRMVIAYKSPDLPFHARLWDMGLNCMLVGFWLTADFLEKALRGMMPALWLFLFIYAVLINLAYLGLTLLAAFLTGKTLREAQSVRYEEFVGSGSAPPVSILISAHNEELSIGRTLDALLKLKYPRYEIIVVNDGSSDGTLDLLERNYILRGHQAAVPTVLPARGIRRVYRSGTFPGLYVIDKENSGKADSLNAGLNLSRFPLFCTVDADTILEEEALFQLVLPLWKDPEGVVAATGMVRAPEPTTFLSAIQAVEYMRAYNIGRMGWNAFNAQVIVSGALSLYRKDWVVRVGGYRRYAIGEDVELNMRIHRVLLESGRKYRIPYVPSARCLTQVPADLKGLARQRRRWQQGLVTIVRLNARALFNPKYGCLGMVAMPFYALLELPAPVLELFGCLLMPLFSVFGMLGVRQMLILLGLVWMYGSGLSFFAVLLDRKHFRFYKGRSYGRMLFWLFFESFGFHQLTVFWRLQGIAEYLRGGRVREMGWISPGRLQAA